MKEKRPSWKDILWTPIYDFVDHRWGTTGLRVFAISIGLLVLGVALWGWNQNRAQVPRGESVSILVFELDAPDQPLRTPDQPLSNQDQPFDPQYQRYVTNLRLNIRSAAAGLSENIIATAVFLTDVLEAGLRSVQAERQQHVPSPAP